jgi:formylglycine-generating enzyme required for sulfatase activity
MKHAVLFFFSCAILFGCSEVEKPVTPSGCRIDMALVPAGTFRMGGYKGSDDNKPIHEVTISRAFLMSRTEVTQALWKAVMGTEPSWFRGDSLPVEQVSWRDAVAFCNRLSGLEGLNACYAGSDTLITCDFTKNGYRLPTEAEWEYACRGGTTTDFSSGDMSEPFCSPLDSALDWVGWYCGNAGFGMEKVRQKRPNAFGLHDMHGNVWEWCWDWFGAYAPSPATDPRGPANGTTHVLRGGSFNLYAWMCCSYLRNSDTTGAMSSDLGFRVARTH